MITRRDFQNVQWILSILPPKPFLKMYGDPSFPEKPAGRIELIIFPIQASYMNLHLKFKHDGRVCCEYFIIKFGVFRQY